MKKTYLTLLAVVFMIYGCATKKPANKPFKPDVYLNAAVVRVDTLTWVDSSRNRVIPIAIYSRDYLTNIKDQEHKNIKRPLVILNPGYGGTRDGYRYIANNLAVNGYMVVTIQHDLPADDSLPKTGDIYKSRKPIWDRGVKSIFFVTEKLKKEYPKLDYRHIILIGHSNGGDIAMLIANEYPEFAKTVITLDNRRVPFPRSSSPKIFSIRSGDQPADPNVLPSVEGQERYGIKIVKVATKHNDMGGAATDAQKKEINDYILDFLKDN
jgi:pimeloyl-ACP methyl ester carboxylesterase